MAAEKPADSLAAALAAFQADLPTVRKGATGQVPGRRDYKYADLDDLSAAVLPKLAAHGLSFTAQPTLNGDGRFVLRYELMHTSGEKKVGEYPLPTGTAWEIGSAITYGRRYCLEAATGVVATEDDDGQAAEQSQRRPQQASPADQARAQLKSTCKENGWDLAKVAARYPGDLKAETDANAINKFTKDLFAVADTELKAAS